MNDYQEKLKSLSFSKGRKSNTTVVIGDEGPKRGTPVGTRTEHDNSVDMRSIGPVVTPLIRLEGVSGTLA